MSRVRSLRRDLVFGLGVGLIAFWIAAVGGAFLIMREELDEIYDSLMEQMADRLLPAAVQNDAAAMPLQAEELLIWVLRDEDGRIIRRSSGSGDEVFATAPRPGFSTIGDYRHFVLQGGGYGLDVASPLQERREAAFGVLMALLVPALILLPLSLGGVLWFTKSRLRPVEALSAEVAGRHPEELRPLATQGLQAELLPLRDEVNRLMGGLREALDAERAFSANAAHELRTPIAATLAHAQRLISEAPEGALRNRALNVETELRRVTRLVEKLLQLSRTENSAVQSATETDIAPILGLVASDFRVSCALPDTPVMSRLDPDTFAILARNLIENAVTHGHDVYVVLSGEGTLRVTNRGPIVPAAKIPLLTRRFERGAARGPGSGLGLAIVASIARNSGSALHLTSPAPGQLDGFEAKIDV